MLAEFIKVRSALVVSTLELISTMPPVAQLTTRNMPQFSR